ncbi:MAG: hypothetical protein WBD55_05070 [Dehalococcoidia bacterium]
MVRFGSLRRLFSPTVLALAGLALLALVPRLALFPHTAYLAPNPHPLADATVWQIWGRDLWRYGLDDIDQITPKTYLGYHYVFWAVAQVYALTSPDFVIPSTRLHYMMKVPPILFDLLSMFVIFAATRRVAPLLPDRVGVVRRWAPVQTLERGGVTAEDTLGLTAGALYVFSPGVIYDSAVWAQSESVITFFMLAAILTLATGRVGPAWALWAVAFVIKPQPLVIVPALAAFTFWRFGWWGVARGAAGAAVGAFALLGYFLATGNARYIWEVYQELFRTFDTQISVNAWNLWWPGQQLNDLRASDVLIPLGPVSLTVDRMSFLLLAATTLATLSYLNTRRDLVGLLVSCAMLEFVFYLFPLSTHERYLYPFFPFLAPMLLLQPRWLLLFLPLTAIFFLNVFFAAPSDPDMSKAALNSDLGLALSMVNVALFAITATALLTAAFRARPWPPLLRPIAT